MGFSDSVSEEEAILLHMVSQLNGTDPIALLKAVGIQGAEQILVEQASKSIDPKHLAKFKSSLFNVAQEYHQAKCTDLYDQIKLLQRQLTELQRKYKPSFSERIGLVSLCSAIFGAGILLGVTIQHIRI